MINVVAFIPSIANYRGHCMAAVAEAIKSSVYRHAAIQEVPPVVSYDEYVGLVGIVNAERSDVYALAEVQALFNS